MKSVPDRVPAQSADHQKRKGTQPPDDDTGAYAQAENPPDLSTTWESSTYATLPPIGHVDQSPYAHGLSISPAPHPLQPSSSRLTPFPDGSNEQSIPGPEASASSPEVSSRPRHRPLASFKLLTETRLFQTHKTTP